MSGEYAGHCGTDGGSDAGGLPIKAAGPMGSNPASRRLRLLLTTAGLICVGLGAVGAFVPLLPTTPFLLLAAACFARSSDRFYRWLMTNKFMGTYIRNYTEHRATTMATKVGSTAMLWCCLAFAAAFFTESPAVRSLLLVVALGVTVHLASLKTIRHGTSSDASTEDGVQKGRA